MYADNKWTGEDKEEAAEHRMTTMKGEHVTYLESMTSGCVSKKF